LDYLASIAAVCRRLHHSSYPLLAGYDMGVRRGNLRYGWRLKSRLDGGLRAAAKSACAVSKEGAPHVAWGLQLR
jgi:hypothetical protein